MIEGIVYSAPVIKYNQSLLNVYTRDNCAHFHYRHG